MERYINIMSLLITKNENTPNTACSRRVGVCRIYKPLSTFGLVHVSNSVLACIRVEISAAQPRARLTNGGRAKIEGGSKAAIRN
jgi:hypothetical protein